MKGISGTQLFTLARGIVRSAVSRAIASVTTRDVHSLLGLVTIVIGSRGYSKNGAFYTLSRRFMYRVYIVYSFRPHGVHGWIIQRATALLRGRCCTRRQRCMLAVMRILTVKFTHRARAPLSRDRWGRRCGSLSAKSAARRFRVRAGSECRVHVIACVRAHR